MHFDAGKLNKRITFLHTVDKDGELGIVKERVVFRTCWAKVRMSRSYETSINEKLNGEYVYTILVRYFKGLTLDMQIQHHDEILQITQINNIDERNYAYEIIAKCVIDKK